MIAAILTIVIMISAYNTYTLNGISINLSNVSDKTENLRLDYEKNNKETNARIDALSARINDTNLRLGKFAGMLNDINSRITIFEKRLNQTAQGNTQNEETKVLIKEVSGAGIKFGQSYTIVNLIFIYKNQFYKDFDIPVYGLVDDAERLMGDYERDLERLSSYNFKNEELQEAQDALRDHYHAVKMMLDKTVQYAKTPNQELAMDTSRAFIKANAWLRLVQELLGMEPIEYSSIK